MFTFEMSNSLASAQALWCITKEATNQWPAFLIHGNSASSILTQVRCSMPACLMSSMQLLTTKYLTILLANPFIRAKSSSTSFKSWTAKASAPLKSIKARQTLPAGKYASLSIKRYIVPILYFSSRTALRWWPYQSLFMD